jgi:hypothetical protein
VINLPLLFLFITFFFLDEKEAKNQDRTNGQRTGQVTLRVRSGHRSGSKKEKFLLEFL